MDFQASLHTLLYSVQRFAGNVLERAKHRQTKAAQKGTVLSNKVAEQINIREKQLFGCCCRDAAMMEPRLASTNTLRQAIDAPLFAQSKSRAD